MALYTETHLEDLPLPSTYCFKHIRTKKDYQEFTRTGLCFEFEPYLSETWEGYLLQRRAWEELNS